MATADIHCPNCAAISLPKADDTFEYPNDTAPGTSILWEHCCPSYVVKVDDKNVAVLDADGNPVPALTEAGETVPNAPYFGTFVVPGADTPKA